MLSSVQYPEMLLKSGSIVVSALVKNCVIGINLLLP